VGRHHVRHAHLVLVVVVVVVLCKGTS
jgi:hypothetical protein